VQFAIPCIKLCCRNAKLAAATTVRHIHIEPSTQEVWALCAAPNVETNGAGMGGRWTVARIPRTKEPTPLSVAHVHTIRGERRQRSVPEKYIEKKPLH